MEGAAKSWSWRFTWFKGAGQGRVRDLWVPFGKLALVAAFIVGVVILIASLRGKWVGGVRAQGNKASD